MNNKQKKGAVGQSIAMRIFQEEKTYPNARRVFLLCCESGEAFPDDVVGVLREKLQKDEDEHGREAEAENLRLSKKSAFKNSLLVCAIEEKKLSKAYMKFRENYLHKFKKDNYKKGINKEFVFEDSDGSFRKILIRHLDSLIDEEEDLGAIFGCCECVEFKKVFKGKTLTEKIKIYREIYRHYSQLSH